MASEVKLPELGENLPGGDVLEVKVAVGDEVSLGQPLVEIEAEKSTVEVPSPLAGQVTKLLVKKGDSLQVGQAFCLIEGKNGEKNGVQKAPVREASSSEMKSEPRVEDGGLKIENQESKTPRLPAIVHPPSSNLVSQPFSPTTSKVIPAGPATRRLARELGIDLSQVPGSASGGRVTQDDVKAYVRGLASNEVPIDPQSPRTTVRALGASPAKALPDFERWGPVERQPLHAVRRKTAEQMSLAWSLIPHVTQHDQADITDLESFRKQQEAKGQKLTVTAFALKAAAIALKHLPQFNSSLDSAAGQVILKKYIHIGVAVDTDRGLLVPILRDVDKKSVGELAQELSEIAEKARQKKLTPDDLRGGTFTITNLGGIGGTAFTPIINYPEVAILGLSRGRWQPTVMASRTCEGSGTIVPRLVLPLSLSYDHRVLDGAAAARFTRGIVEMLENPLLMLV
jgi:pyruvate dehydrogenase E2 component (dihydrolipoamide acetyltransferase)